MCQWLALCTQAGWGTTTRESCVSLTRLHVELCFKIPATVANLRGVGRMLRHAYACMA